MDISYQSATLNARVGSTNHWRATWWALSTLILFPGKRAQGSVETVLDTEFAALAAGVSEMEVVDLEGVLGGVVITAAGTFDGLYAAGTIHTNGSPA